jgi:1,4-alpha-glucan branching enzyme
VFNFHPTKSFENYKIGTVWNSDHVILFDSDEARFGGHDRLAQAKNRRFLWQNESVNERKYSLKLYVPNRCCIVLIAEENIFRYNLDIQIEDRVEEVVK